MMDTPAVNGGRPASQDRADHTEYRPRPTFSGKGQNAVEILVGPGQGTVHRFDAQLLIGRGVRCGLVIDDATVSREHLFVEGRGGRWLAVSRNPRNPALKNGVPFQAGALATGDMLAVGPVLLRFALSKPKGGLALPPGLRRRLGDKRLLVGAGFGIFAVILALFFLSQPARSPQDAVVASARSKEQAQQDSEYMLKVSTLLLQARRLHEEGRDEQALARLDSLLAIDAGNAEALQLKAELQAGMATKAAEARALRDQVAAAQEKARPQVREAERLLAAGDTAGARAAAQRALAEAPEGVEARQIMDKVEAREASDQRLAAQQAKEAVAARQALTGLYDAAAAALAADDWYKALVLYRRLGEEEGEPARTAARHKAAEIQDALVKRVLPDFAAGQKLYAQKKYAEAYAVWVKVLQTYPEAKETQAKVAELTPMLEAEAKHLYEEGLVYEGLGDRQTAVDRWKAALAAMPLEDNTYHRRAAEKLGLAPKGTGRP